MFDERNLKHLTSIVSDWLSEFLSCQLKYPIMTALSFSLDDNTKNSLQDRIQNKVSC